VDATLVTLEAPPNLLGDYHLGACPGSSACNLGAANKAVPAYQQPAAPTPYQPTGTTTLNAPTTDYDNQARPALGGFDSGADEFSGATPPPPPPPPSGSSLLYFSLDSNTSPTGLSNGDDADIYRANTGGTFNRLFDATATGIPGSADVDGVTIVSGTSVITLYVSFAGGTTISIPGPDLSVADEDIARCVSTSITAGVVTGCTWSQYFDGSDVSLGGGGEDLDAFEILPNGNLVISTNDGASVPGITGETGSDLLLFTPTSLGPTTAGTWSVYFDGSDVSLGTTSSSGAEDIDGVAIAPNGDVYLSTTGNFSVPGISGANEDVFVCHPTSLGNTTACSYLPTLYFDGSTVGLGGTDVDAIDLP
jgi:hypothetical protein